MDTAGRSFLAWQWAHYGEGHRDRLNLAIHAATVPIFWLGTCALALAPMARVVGATAGVLGLILPVVAQGRGHRGEATAPSPFRGPGDFLARIFAEQWITFPRFVLSGGVARALRRR